MTFRAQAVFDAGATTGANFATISLLDSGLTAIMSIGVRPTQGWIIAAAPNVYFFAVSPDFPIEFVIRANGDGTFDITAREIRLGGVIDTVTSFVPVLPNQLAGVGFGAGKDPGTTLQSSLAYNFVRFDLDESLTSVDDWSLY